MVFLKPCGLVRGHLWVAVYFVRLVGFVLLLVPIVDQVEVYTGHFGESLVLVAD